ncbi:flagellar biosynthetic protein FliO [Chimaeribacter californicus]|uniref:Flagellar protein n=1 Tax=Chimaeribacter californicus TaxID=2060067 RepID=A0A2N5E709_9GAMM|nr:flagellar biosynthetic protein FliO [Chimaeribacter californicus]
MTTLTNLYADHPAAPADAPVAAAAPATPAAVPAQPATAQSVATPPVATPPVATQPVATPPAAATAAAPAHVAVVPAAPAISTGSLVTQVGSGLGGILLLILLAGWVVKRLGFAPQRRNSALLKVTASCQVGQRERVVIVEVDNTWLVLGVTPTQITPLHTLSAPPAEPPAAATATPAAAQFRQLLNNVLHRPDKSA